MQLSAHSTVVTLSLCLRVDGMTLGMTSFRQEAFLHLCCSIQQGPGGICCHRGVLVLLLQLKAGVWGFDDFLRNGLVEYLDVNEEDNALIALYEENIGAPDMSCLFSITLQLHL